jgi:DNA polymerase/3'-5' exonuclease PolX
LNHEPQHHIWAYRKAAWAVEDMQQEIGLVHRTMGLKGLQGIPDIGPSLGKVVEDLLTQESAGKPMDMTI